MASAHGDQGATSASDGLRVSDAERQEVADALSKHFADGRLDQGEFSDRLELALAARTRADLDPLLADLPPFPGQAPRAAANAVSGSDRRGGTDYPHGTGRPDVRHHPGRGLQIVLVVAVVVLVSRLSHGVLHPHVPWLLIAALVFLVYRRRWHRH
jgi:hypothetical protein